MKTLLVGFSTTALAILAAPVFAGAGRAPEAGGVARVVVVRGADVERLASRFLASGATRIVVDRARAMVVVQPRDGDADAIVRRVGALPSAVETLGADSEEAFLVRAEQLLGGPLDRAGVGIVTTSVVTLSPDLVRIGSEAARPLVPAASTSLPISDDFEGELNAANGGKWNIYVNDTSEGKYWGRSSCDHLSGQYCADAIRGGTKGAALSCTYSYPFGFKTYLELANTVTLPAGTPAWLNFGFKGQSNDTGYYNYNGYGVYVSLDHVTGVGYKWHGDWSTSWNMQSLDLTAWEGIGDLRQHGSFWVWLFLDATASYENIGFGFRVDDFSISASGGATFSRWVPVVTHVDVPSRNAWWRSDVAVLNRSTQAANVTLKMHAPSGLRTKSIQVVPRGQAILTDLALQLGVTTESGSLEVVSDQDLVVSSRTYSQVDASHTYGQDYEGYDSSALMSGGQSAHLPQLTQNVAYRTNIGVTNTGTATANVTVTLYDSAGNPAGWSDTRDYAPAQFYQYDQPFLRTPAGTIDSGYALVTVNSGSGVVVYASVIDQNTGDATTITMKR